MMKKIIYIISLSILFACNAKQDRVISTSEKTVSTENESIKVDESNFELNGTWGLTNYFDTIIENKELAKYRLQIPTWFAILLEIKNDSLQSFGSIENGEYWIDRTKDTLITLISNVSGNKWHLIASEPNLKLIQSPNSESTDSTVYIFRKRNDLNNFTKENKDFFIIGNNVTDYFNDQILKGKYVNQKTQEEIIFGANGQLKGISGFDSYEIRNYFGTLHMHKNLDVVTFKNKESREYKQYNWVFSGNDLTLTEFVYEKVTYNGETYDGDYLILGKEKIKLKNTEHNKVYEH